MDHGVYSVIFNINSSKGPLPIKRGPLPQSVCPPPKRYAPSGQVHSSNGMEGKAPVQHGRDS